MLIKATRLHPGVPLQVLQSHIPVMVDMVDIEVVVDMVVAEVVVNGMVVVEAVVVVVGNVISITELIIWWISFLALSLSSIEGHCQSSPLSSTLTSVICPWPLAILTDPGANSKRTETKKLTIKIIFRSIFLPEH